ncbi:PorT family protein [Dyadobacter sp. CY261]|uniref:PorT family protein n=1 Tax=Dyadobacter sp. CY261 TaxID=2907203 RepID=UPI001F2248CE|nr:PorT family protein [Dyadobacter sp. CY261]MCF0071506.1 PorT family protein [Dyadobacter sp. CY261]
MKSKIYAMAALFILAAIGTRADSLKFSNEFSRPGARDKDSIIVTFGDKTRLIIYGENRAELERIMKYDLNALLRDLKVRLDSTRADTTLLREEFDGNKYLKNPGDVVEKDYVRIGLRGIHIKDGDTKVSIDGKGVEVKEGDEVVASDSSYRRIGKRFHRASWGGSSPRKGFNVAFGLNTYGANEATPGYDKATYDLKPFGSRYVSLGYVASANVIRGKNARLHLDFGIDFSWYNMMYDGNNTIEKTDDGVEFNDVVNGQGQPVEVRKSKLVVPYVNLSIMPTLSFSRSFISYISAGVYGGYRIGSYTKVRVYGTKDVEHDRKNFYIEDLRYGLAAEIGIRNFPDFFVNYDLNNLYEANRGPSVRMLSFGVRLF